MHRTGARVGSALALVALVGCRPSVRSDTTFIGRERAAREEGCSIDLFPGTTPSYPWEDVGTTRVICDAGRTRDACISEIERQACLAGADAFYGLHEGLYGNATVMVATLAARRGAHGRTSGGTAPPTRETSSPSDGEIGTLVPLLAPCAATGAAVEVAVATTGGVMRVEVAGANASATECVDRAVRAATFASSEAPRILRFVIDEGGPRSGDPEVMRAALAQCDPNEIAGAIVWARIGTRGNAYGVGVSGASDAGAQCVETALRGAAFRTASAERGLRVTLPGSRATDAELGITPSE